MKKFLFALLLMSSVSYANTFSPVYEMRYPGGLRIQLSDKEEWCKTGERAAKWFDVGEVKNGCWTTKGDGVIVIEWPGGTTLHPFWKFVPLEI